MLGLIRPTGGSVRLFGRDPQLGVEALEGVAGFVEAPSFYPYLSGRENLRALRGARRRRRGGADRRVLEIVELARPRKDKVGGYSHGMRQRLGIAAALLRRPRLLLLDEPATGLDPAGMRDMRELIRNLAGHGITVLLSSHLLAEVEELCNRVAIVQRRPRRLRGRAGRAAPPGRGQLSPADQRRRASREPSATPSRGSTRSAMRPAADSRSTPRTRPRSASSRWRWPSPAPRCSS